MSTVGKSLALFSEDELPSGKAHSSNAKSGSPAVEHSSSSVEHSSSSVESGSSDREAGASKTERHSSSQSCDDLTCTAQAVETRVQESAAVGVARTVQPTLEEQVAVRSASERAQLWLALKFFSFPLEVLCREAKLERATVVVADQGGRTCVIACDQQAYDHGVRTGMALAAAYALVHEIDVLAQDEAQELAALERLGTWAKKFTPLVSLCSPGALLLEVHGSLALFGGIDGLLQGVQHDLRVLGFAHVHAVSPTPTAALWLAQHEQGIALDDESLKSQLGKLPLAVTAWPERVLSRLQGMGVRTLRDCLRLPRDGFARRIGKQHLKELDQALGLAPDPRVNYQPPDKFVAKRELLFALESVTMIMRGLDQLLIELCAFLRGRQSGIQVVRITLYHPHTAASVLNVGTASACRDHARLSLLVHEKIEQLTLPEGVVAISMVSGRLYPLTGFDGQLFSDSAHSDVRWPELVEKLRARLGAHAVTGLCLVPEHRPEQAWKYTEPGTQSAMPVPGVRPLWLLAKPHRMQNRDGLPYWYGRLNVLHGPERIESGWWDGQDAARDYFVVINPCKLTLWVYCERPTSATRAPSGSQSNNSQVDAPQADDAPEFQLLWLDESAVPASGEASSLRPESPSVTKPVYPLPQDPGLCWYVHGVFA